jgi:hypothetical protein
MVLNVHEPSDKKSDDSKDSFIRNYSTFFYNFPKYHIKILLGDFNAKLGKEDIFKPTIRNSNLTSE